MCANNRFRHWPNRARSSRSACSKRSTHTRRSASGADINRMANLTCHRPRSAMRVPRKRSPMSPPRPWVSVGTILHDQNASGWHPATGGVERAIRQLINGISHRIGASWSWPSEPTRDAQYYYGTTQNQPRASWCVTNTDTQTITPLRRCRLNLSLRLSAWHTTRTRRDPRRGPRPGHAHRTHGARAGRDARGRTRRASYFGSSSSHRRRWCVQVIQELAKNAATNRKRTGPYRTATRGVPVRSASGDLRACLVAFSRRCDAAAGRPGGCEHFPCLGHFCMTPGHAINHRGACSVVSLMAPFAALPTERTLRTTRKSWPAFLTN